jgi:predicted aldo/keto reductase-like oxidoreductase
MLYRTLGRTGLKVSQLGFGAMRLPMIGEGETATVDRSLSTPMIHRAIELGVNYFDTAIGYCNQDSQRAVGDALVGKRDQVILSTKNHFYGNDEKQWWTNLENSLQRLRTDHIDIYNHHGINWKAYCTEVEPYLGNWMRKARDQGLIRHICASFHDNNDSLIKIIDTGYVDVITLQYNMLDRSLEQGIAHAAEMNIGVVVMGPVGGGRLGVSSEVLASLIPNISRVPELALRFVLADPHVSVALSGMSTMQHVEENAKVASDPVALTPEHLLLIDQHLTRLQKMASLYCTGCNYCKPCPNEVDIPGVFQRYNLARVYGLWERARNDYAVLMGQKHAGDQCIQCGECEPKCPQHLEIRRQMEEAHAALAPK